MKTAILNVLEEIENLPAFTRLKAEKLGMLEALAEYKGLALRFYTGVSANPWKVMRFHAAKKYTFEELAEINISFAENTPETPEELLIKKINGEKCYVFLSPYLVDNSHLADSVLIISASSKISAKEWHFFADSLALKLCGKYYFPAQLIRNQFEHPEKLLDFLREIQFILNTNRKINALPPGNAQKQAKIWFEEDTPILNSILLKLQRSFNLHTVFLLQQSAPRFCSQIAVMPKESAKSASDEIEEMVSAAIQYESLDAEIINKSVIYSQPQSISSSPLSPLLFACQAGGQTYGCIGLLLPESSMVNYLNHHSKLMPMLASQLGLYFSHLYRLRKEALHGRMLQQINQTCNTINSSVVIGAILFKLIESLNYLFGQYSGAILIFSPETHELEITNYLGGEIPSNISLEKLISQKGPIIDAITEGSAFDNRLGRCPLPIRYVLPLAGTPQAMSLNSDFLPLQSLGGVVLFESSLNRQLSEEELTKLIPILLNGIGASLQVARNYAEKLDTIKALEGLMNRLSDTDALLDEMILIIRRLMRVCRISFLEVDENEEYLTIKKGYGLPKGIINNTKIKIGEEISGVVAQNGVSCKIDNIEVSGRFKKRSKEVYFNRSLLSVPLIKTVSKNKKKVIGVINVNNKTNGLTFTDQDQQLLEAIAHLVVTALENVKLMREEHENNLIERQLNDAKDIQMSLMPKSFNHLPKSVEIFGKSIPARQIGGDYFDVMFMNDGRLLLILGDVSGKGMPAALLMAVTRTIFKSAAAETSDPVEILERVNEKISDELDSYHFVTLQLVAINTDTGECEMSSAGHGPLMVRLKGKNSLIETKSGVPLGITVSEGMYDKKAFTMAKNDTLLMYTDGLPEERNGKGEMFGSARIERLLTKSDCMSCPELIETLIASSQGWRGKAEPHDDLTVLTLKYKGKTR